MEEEKMTEINELNEETENNKGKQTPKSKMTLHLILALIILFIIGIVIFRLIRWNSNKIVVSSEYDPSDQLECLDYFVHPDENQSKLRNPDGRERILVIGNQCASRCSDDSTSIIEQLKEKVDAEFITLIADRSKLTAVSWPGYYDVYDVLNLFRISNVLVEKDKSMLGYYEIEDNFINPDSLQAYVDTLYQTDLNDIDTVLIIYDLSDMYNAIPPIAGGTDNVNGLYGSLYQSIELLQSRYPHLEFFISSPFPEYIDRDGVIELSSANDYFGYGTSSDYVSVFYNVALESFVSYIDNYYYIIDEENITEYVEGFRLTPKGVDVISSHIAEFLNK